MQYHRGAAFVFKCRARAGQHFYRIYSFTTLSLCAGLKWNSWQNSICCSAFIGDFAKFVLAWTPRRLQLARFWTCVLFLLSQQRKFTWYSPLHSFVVQPYVLTLNTGIQAKVDSVFTYQWRKFHDKNAFIKCQVKGLLPFTVVERWYPIFSWLFLPMACNKQYQCWSHRRNRNSCTEQGSSESHWCVNGTNVHEPYITNKGPGVTPQV